MEHQLPSLPYEKNSLTPFISAETMECHYESHHRGYVTRLNELIQGTRFEHMPLYELIMSAEGSIFNYAAQVWNHSFFWNCISPKKTQVPDSLSERINRRFGSFNQFRDEFNRMALSNFGSGWTWLVLNRQKELEIVNTSNAGTPMTLGLIPLMTLDIWEHAYYLDYRNTRRAYVDAFWEFVNWNFVAKQI